MKLNFSRDADQGNGNGHGNGNGQAAGSGTVAVVRGSREPRHLTEPSIIDQERLPAFVRIALIAIAGLLVAFVGWAGVVSIDEIAIAPGQVVPSGTVKVVQHLEGGVILDVKVQENDVVTVGDPVVTFDPAPAESELGQMAARLIGLLMREERLTASNEGREPDFAQIDPGKLVNLLLSEVDEIESSNYRARVEDIWRRAIEKIRIDKLADEQRQIWRNQLAARRSAQSVIESQIDQRTKEIAQRTDMLTIAERQLQITTEELAIRQAGVRSGVVAQQIMLETKRAQVTAEGEVLRLREEIRLGKDALEESTRRLANLGNEQRQQVLDELGALGTEREQVKNALGKLVDRVIRLVVLAPISGSVQELKVHAKGEVVPPGGLLMRVVPLNDVLEAHVRISPSDIGHVKPGDRVKLKVSSFEFTRFGTLDGKLRQVSKTTLTDESTASATNSDRNSKVYYLGVVELAQPFVGKTAGQNMVQPGMAVEANIVTGQKTLLQYILGPVYRAAAGAFKER